MIPAQSRERHPRRAEWIEPIKTAAKTENENQPRALEGEPCSQPARRPHRIALPYQIVTEYTARHSPEVVRVWPTQGEGLPSRTSQPDGPAGWRLACRE